MEAVARSSGPAMALDPSLISDAAVAEAEEAPTAVVAAIKIHTPYQVDPGTPRHPGGGQIDGVAAGNSHHHHHRPHGTTGVSASTSTGAAAATGTRAAAPLTSKVVGRPSQASSRRLVTDGAAAAKDFYGPQPAPRAVSAHPERRISSPSAAAAERAKSSRRVLVSAPGDVPGSAATNGSRPAAQRRTHFIDPSAPADAAAEAAVVSAAPRLRGGRAASPTLTQPPRTAAAQTTSGGVNGATTITGHAALYTQSIPQHRQPTRTPQRVPADAANPAEPYRRRRQAPTEAPHPAPKSAAAAAAAPLALGALTATAPSDDSEHSLASPSASPITVSSPTQHSHAANGGARGLLHEAAVVDVAAPTSAVASDAAPATKAAAKAAHRTAAVAAAAAHRDTAAAADAQRDNKHIVISRPSANPHALRMSELTRPSEAYKITLHPTHQRSALARRSRQPRKVLNVFLTKYPLIRQLADEKGFEMETDEEELNEYKFNLCWSDTVLSLMRLVRLSNWQRTNHFPSMYLLCRKGHLGTTLGKLRRKLPMHFAYYPRTWSMRSERLQFTQYMAAVRQRRILKYFIMKPNSGCQGRGIIVARDPLTALEEHTLDNYIVQEYVHRPLLLEGKKFDLRVYVLLTSIRHPSIFIFNDGLVRICTEAYETPNEENVKQACKHLTNYAVNKKSSDYVFNTDVEHMDVGNKRNFGFLNRWLTESGYSPDTFWDEVGFIIVKTILAAQPSIARVYDSCFPTGFNDGYCCFEVLGFDILIDNKMKPWLMEVNHTPSFATETPLDYDIKSKLISEVWNIIDCKATDYERDRQREREEFAKRNMPPWASNHPLYGSQLSKSTSRRIGVDDVETPPDHSPAPTSRTANGEEEMPSYVLARRRLEDSKLKNFKRIYPSADPEVQLVYDTIQNLATLESANSRLYYNSTIAVPVLQPLPSPTPSVRTNLVVPGRVRPPQLGPLLTTSRVNGTNGSPSTAAPQRTPATPVTPNAAAAAAAAAASAASTADTIPSTILVPSVPGLTGAAANNTSTSTASPVTSVPSATREGQAATFKHMEKDLLRHRRRSSEAHSGAAAALSTASTSRSSATTSENGAAATAAKPSQPLRVHTPRISPTHATTAASPVAPQQTTPTAAAADGAKPRVTEVHRRVTGRPTTVGVATTPTAAAQTTDAATTADSTAMPASVAPHKVKADKLDTAAAAAAAGTRHPTFHQNGDVVTPPPSAPPQPAAQGPIRITCRTATGARSPTAAPLAASGSGRPSANNRELSASTKRRSVSLGGSTRELDFSGIVHARQKSQDRELHSKFTHPEPTEEELARLATLQAMLDYEAAADPQPDDDDDYNLTE